MSCSTGNSEDNTGGANYKTDSQNCPDRLKHKETDFSCIKILFSLFCFNDSGSTWVMFANSSVPMKSGDFSTET